MTHWREPLERPIRRLWRMFLGMRIKGQVINRSSRTLWVLETDSGIPLAHRLEPGCASPATIDADAFRAVDGTSIDGDPSWIKIYDFVTASVEDAPGGRLQATGWLRRPVEEREFGSIVYTDVPWSI